MIKQELSLQQTPNKTQMAKKLNNRQQYNTEIISREAARVIRYKLPNKRRFISESWRITAYINTFLQRNSIYPPIHPLLLMLLHTLLSVIDR